MEDTSVKPIDLADAEELVGTTDTMVQRALEVGRRRTDGGKGIDDAQLPCEPLAYLATEVTAAKAVLAYAKAAREQGHRDPIVEEMAAVFAAEVAQRLGGQVDAHPGDFGLSNDLLSQTL